jgi:hypothetical protein
LSFRYNNNCLINVKYKLKTTLIQYCLSKQKTNCYPQKQKKNQTIQWNIKKQKSKVKALIVTHFWGQVFPYVDKNWIKTNIIRICTVNKKVHNCCIRINCQQKEIKKKILAQQVKVTYSWKQMCWQFWSI